MKEIKYIRGEELRKLQLILLDCLSEVDRVCRANNIRYCIAFGTLLGAVRHKGFIPWDDDIDVAMTREEYNKFVKVADQLNPEICFFQDHDNDPEYPWGYGKVRRTGTVYIRQGQEHLKHKTGFMMDIFPLDDLPQSAIGTYLFGSVCFILRKMTYAQVGWRSERSWFWRGWYKLLSFIPVDVPLWIAKKIRCEHNNNTPNRCHHMFISYGARKVTPGKEGFGLKKEWLTDVTEYEFEGRKFYGMRDYDAALTWQVGDYMTPPPVSEREPHAPCSDYSFGNL